MNSTEKTTTRGAAAYLLLLPVILLWAVNPLIVPDLTGHLPVPEVNFLASVLAMAVLAAGLTVARRWGELRSWKPREWAGALALGAVGIFPYSSLYFLAFSLAPESTGATNIVNYLWPIWTVLLSAIILREPLGWRRILGLLLSFAGVYVIVSKGRFVEIDRHALPAYLAAGTGAFFWGLFSTLGKRRTRDPLLSMMLYQAGACVCFGVVAAAVGGISMPAGADWWRLVLLGCGSNGVAYLLWIMALQRGDTGRISSLAYLVPLVALGYLWIFRGSPITAVHLVALILVVAGPLVQLVPANRPKAGGSAS